MTPNYKNWMPKGMIAGTLGISALSFALSAIAGRTSPEQGTTLRKGVIGALLLTGTTALGAAVWMNKLFWAFSYDGKRQMSRQIIDGTAEYVHLPEGGIGLDVGCGSGALTIACAKRNPQATMVGIDRWGLEYASFSKSLCESNAEAERVSNVSFRKGDAVHLDFPDEHFDAVTSNYVYHNIPSRDRQALLRETLRVLKKGGCFAIHDIMSPAKYGDMERFARLLRQEGYERVELIDTTDGKFMSRSEAKWMGLSGSTLLVGQK